MSTNIRAFLDQPGHKLPLDVTLHGASQSGDELRTVEELRVAGQAFVQLGTLYLDVEIRARIVQPCRRCLTDVTAVHTLQETFEVRIPPAAESVDLWEPALELVLSSHDPNVLCRAACRGLCPACGADLNLDPDHRCSQADERRTLGDLLK